MRKLVLSASLFALTVTAAFAQSFKPQAGDIVVGTALQSPFASGSPFSLLNGGISGRYFLSSDLAVRANVNFTRNSNTQNFRDSVFVDLIKGGAKTLQEGTSNVSNSMFDLRIGAEKHFSGTDRLDPYAGADLILGFGSNKTKDENYNAGTGKAEANFLKESTQSVSAFGVALVAGADFYVLPKVYLGTEFGWSFIANSVGEKTTSVSSDKINAAGTAVENVKEKDVITAGSSNSKAGAGMTTAAFRVGFRF